MCVCTCVSIYKLCPAPFLQPQILFYTHTHTHTPKIMTLTDVCTYKYFL